MSTPALLYAFLLDGTGSARALTQEQIPTQLAENETLWLHWSMFAAETRTWLSQHPNLVEFDCDVLLEENARPRLLQRNPNLALLFLRTIEFSKAHIASELMSLRLCLMPQCLISLREENTGFAQQLANAFAQGSGPKNLSELVFFFAEAVTENINEKVNQFAEFIDDQEDRVDIDPSYTSDHQQMLGVRRTTANLRRILSPQRDIFSSLATSRDSWYSHKLTRHWTELANNLVRALEELELARERTNFILEAERRKREEKMGNVIFWLTLITGFFLPLSFFTGLLGINVAGIPLAENQHGFLIVCLLLGSVVVGQFFLLRWLRWV